MLDLKELEKRLDEALEKETRESLTSWLTSQRLANFESLLGAGRIQEFKGYPYTFNMGFPDIAHYFSENNHSPSELLTEAA